MKFDLQKAFFIIFEIYTTTKSCSALTMAKVRKAMASSNRYPIAGTCEVDEAVIGEKVSGKRRIGAHKKKKVCVVIEKVEKGGISRAYTRSIANFSAKDLAKIFDLHIDKRAKKIDTYEWKGYLPLLKEWNIVKKKSVSGVNFNLMHRFIQQLKGWLRGVHHHASKKYLQAYLDEYCYKFNRHRSINSIFDNAIKRRIPHKPVEHKLLALS